MTVEFGNHWYFKLACLSPFMLDNFQQLHYGNITVQECRSPWILTPSSCNRLRIRKMSWPSRSKNSYLKIWVTWPKNWEQSPIFPLELLEGSAYSSFVLVFSSLAKVLCQAICLSLNSANPSGWTDHHLLSTRSFWSKGGMWSLPTSPAFKSKTTK